MEHYFPDVPGLGNVAVSRHAQERMASDHISQELFENVLLNGDTIPDGSEVVWRQKDGLRVVLLVRPEPFRGAMLVKTVYRIGAQAQAKR